MFFLFLKKDFIYLFLERKREGEREEEKYQCVLTSCVPPTGDLARNPGMCPDWESNQRPFGSHTDTKSIELHQPGLNRKFEAKWGVLYMGVGQIQKPVLKTGRAWV